VIPEHGAGKPGHLLSFALSAGALALLAVGFLVTGDCGGGVTLVVFGAAVGVMGTVVARMGGHVMIPVSAIFVVTLVWAGLLFASQAGCAW
jgi:hypothetical protein